MMIELPAFVAEARPSNYKKRSNPPWQAAVTIPVLSDIC